MNSVRIRWPYRTGLKTLARWLVRKIRARKEPGPDLASPSLPPVSPWARELKPDLQQTAEVTDRLYSKLSDSDIAAIEKAADARQLQILRTAEEPDRRRVTLALGVHHEIPSVLEKTGLSTAVSPDKVHAMARGWLASGGSYYYADLVVGALREVGTEPRAGTRSLDFGCSSGRVVRALAAAYREAEWYGCDPNGEAIGWAKEHLPGITFGVSPQEPPLPYRDDFFDVVFAISIWSHYGERAAVDWLSEMRRVIRPSGHLLLSTHGHQAIAFNATNGIRSDEQLAEIGRTLYERGFWFAEEFGAKGDWGVVNRRWGTAFISPEWLLSQVCPEWRVIDFAAGRLEGHQDLYVLEQS